MGLTGCVEIGHCRRSAKSRHAGRVQRTWTLSFRHRGGSVPSRATLLAALPAVQVTEADWSGNPRDFYSREVKCSAALAPGVALSGRLGLENAMTPGPADPETEDFRGPSLQLTGDDALALDRAWQALARALDAAGYTDETLTQAPAELLRHLAEQDATRAAVLRAEVTAALVQKLSTSTQSFVVASFTLPDDWDRVLGAVPEPARIKEVALDGCDLETLPQALLRFPALTSLSASYNRLRQVGPIPAQLPSLERLWLDGNPLDHFELAELKACARLRTLGLRGTTLPRPPKLEGVTIHSKH